MSKAKAKRAEIPMLTVWPADPDCTQMGFLAFRLPDAELEMRDAMRGRTALAALWDLDQWLRGRVEYGELAPDVKDAFEETRNYLRETLCDRGINIDAE